MTKPPLRPPDRRGGPNTKTMLTWAFLLLLAAAAAQSHSAKHTEKVETLVPLPHTVNPSWGRPSQAGSSPPEIPLLKHDATGAKFRSTDENPKIHKFEAVAPAQHNSAVEARLAKPPRANTRSSALTQARLLQDWEAENIVLLATIDGAIHARDRRTGVELWSLQIPGSPMVETIYHCHNQGEVGGESQCDHEFIFIVEPSKDGNLYIQHKNPVFGLQKLGITVRALAADTPQFVEEPPLVMLAQQESTGYVVDAASGNILKTFSKQSPFINDNSPGRCRRQRGFDDPACEPFGTMYLGRMEYTITMSNKSTGELLATIKFAEWVPNQYDRTLQAQYTKPLDSQHIQTYYNGRIIGLDSQGESGKLHRYTHTLDSPVAGIFDVVRPLGDTDSSTTLVVLSRPISLPGMSISPRRKGGQPVERVFVDRTESGAWYALSENSYPGVTQDAETANIRWSRESTSFDLSNSVEDMVGVHVLSPDRGNAAFGRLTIEGPLIKDLVEEPKKTLVTPDTLQAPTSTNSWPSDFSTLLNFVLLSIFILAAGIQLKVPIMLKMQHYLHTFGIDVSIKSTKAQIFESSSVQTENPIATVEVLQTTEDVSDLLPDRAANGSLTPTRSRAQSVATAAPTPKTQVDNDEENENSSEGESDDEKLQQVNSNEGTENSSEPRRRHQRRGKRGGKKNRKKKQMDPGAMDELGSMTAEVPTKDGLLQVGRLRIDTGEENCLGRGSNGTTVFPGTLDGRAVAIKRLIRSSNSLAAKEIKHLLSSDENPHVIRYFGKEESQHFTYIALDLFTTSLDQFVEKPLHYPELVKLPEGYDVKDCLRQITDGVAHLHSLKLVHRDIKPQNVLVKAVKSNRPVSGLPKLQFVISDFGLCKPLEEGPESTFAPTANHTAAGTTGWRAPELLVNPRASVAAPNANSSTSHSATHSYDGTVVDPPSGRRATKAIDIFSLGCVFYYVMTQGQHPFDIGGTSLGRDLNIKENKFSTDGLRLHEYQFDADDLIMQMLKHDPKERPDTTGVLNHPYFWDVADKLEFLCDVSDCYEKEKNSIKNFHDEKASRTAAELDSLSELAALESLAPNVIGPSNDFHRALPRSFISEMGKQRKYTGSKMIDLLRVIRNKKNHFHDLPEDVKEQMLGGSARGYYEFWVKRFPSLLINCHCVILERGLVERFRMERYYP